MKVREWLVMAATYFCAWERCCRRFSNLGRFLTNEAAKLAAVSGATPHTLENIKQCNCAVLLLGVINGIGGIRFRLLIGGISFIQIAEFIDITW